MRDYVVASDRKYDCDVNISKCVMVKSDYTGPNNSLTNTGNICIPKTGADVGKPCASSGNCASGSWCHSKNDNSQKGVCERRK